MNLAQFLLFARILYLFPTFYWIDNTFIMIVVSIILGLINVVFNTRLSPRYFSIFKNLDYIKISNNYLLCSPFSTFH